jgi:hypothetical protein
LNIPKIQRAVFGEMHLFLAGQDIFFSPTFSADQNLCLFTSFRPKGRKCICLSERSGYGAVVITMCYSIHKHEFAPFERSTRPCLRPINKKTPGMEARRRE